MSATLQVTSDLFATAPAMPPARERLADGAVLLRAWAGGHDEEYRLAVNSIVATAPFRHMTTPGGFVMSVAMSNCGAAGWITDRTGYRYSAIDPLTATPWPAMPALLRTLAVEAAAAAGFSGFEPDACLLNRYAAGARMTAHQDRNERDLDAPIVSVSLGLPAVFLFGGATRKAEYLRVAVGHGDIVVWGGAARLNYHGVARLKPAQHPFAGEHRINLTFRKAL